MHVTDIDIWIPGNQSDMETCSGKYGSSISCLFIRNRALEWEGLVHMGVIETEGGNPNISLCFIVTQRKKNENKKQEKREDGGR